MNDAFRPDPNALDIDIEFNALVVNVCQFQFNLKINICPFHSYIEVIEGEKCLACLVERKKCGSNNYRRKVLLWRIRQETSQTVVLVSYLEKFIDMI